MSQNSPLPGVGTGAVRRTRSRNSTNNDNGSTTSSRRTSPRRRKNKNRNTASGDGSDGGGAPLPALSALSDSQQAFQYVGGGSAGNFGAAANAASSISFAEGEVGGGGDGPPPPLPPHTYHWQTSLLITALSFFDSHCLTRGQLAVLKAYVEHCEEEGNRELQRLAVLRDGLARGFGGALFTDSKQWHMKKGAQRSHTSAVGVSAHLFPLLNPSRAAAVVPDDGCSPPPSAAYSPLALDSPFDKPLPPTMMDGLGSGDIFNAPLPTSSCAVSDPLSPPSLPFKLTLPFHGAVIVSLLYEPLNAEECGATGGGGGGGVDIGIPAASRDKNKCSQRSLASVRRVRKLFRRLVETVAIMRSAAAAVAAAGERSSSSSRTASDVLPPSPPSAAEMKALGRRLEALLGSLGLGCHEDFDADGSIGGDNGDDDDEDEDEDVVSGLNDDAMCSAHPPNPNPNATKRTVFPLLGDFAASLTAEAKQHHGVQRTYGLPGRFGKRGTPIVSPITSPNASHRSLPQLPAALSGSVSSLSLGDGAATAAIPLRSEHNQSKKQNRPPPPPPPPEAGFKALVTATTATTTFDLIFSPHFSHQSNHKTIVQQLHKNLSGSFPMVVAKSMASILDRRQYFILELDCDDEDFRDDEYEEVLALTRRGRGDNEIAQCNSSSSAAGSVGFGVKRRASMPDGSGGVGGGADTAADAVTAGGCHYSSPVLEYFGRSADRARYAEDTQRSDASLQAMMMMGRPTATNATARSRPFLMGSASPPAAMCGVAAAAAVTAPLLYRYHRIATLLLAEVDGLITDSVLALCDPLGLGYLGLGRDTPPPPPLGPPAANAAVSGVWKQQQQPHERRPSQPTAVAPPSALDGEEANRSHSGRSDGTARPVPSTTSSLGARRVPSEDGRVSDNGTAVSDRSNSTARTEAPMSRSNSNIGNGDGDGLRTASGLAIRRRKTTAAATTTATAEPLRVVVPASPSSLSATVGPAAVGAQLQPQSSSSASSRLRRPPPPPAYPTPPTGVEMLVCCMLDLPSQTLAVDPQIATQQAPSAPTATLPASATIQQQCAQWQSYYAAVKAYRAYWDTYGSGDGDGGGAHGDDVDVDPMVVSVKSVGNNVNISASAGLTAPAAAAPSSPSDTNTARATTSQRVTIGDEKDKYFGVHPSALPMPAVDAWHHPRSPFAPLAPFIEARCSVYEKMAINAYGDLIALLMNPQACEGNLVGGPADISRGCYDDTNGDHTTSSSANRGGGSGMFSSGSRSSITSSSLAQRSAPSPFLTSFQLISMLPPHLGHFTTRKLLLSMGDGEGQQQSAEEEGADFDDDDDCDDFGTPTKSAKWLAGSAAADFLSRHLALRRDRYEWKARAHKAMHPLPLLVKVAGDGSEKAADAACNHTLNKLSSVSSLPSAASVASAGGSRSSFSSTSASNHKGQNQRRPSPTATQSPPSPLEAWVSRRDEQRFSAKYAAELDRLHRFAALTNSSEDDGEALDEAEILSFIADAYKPPSATSGKSSAAVLSLPLRYYPFAPPSISTRNPFRLAYVPQHSTAATPGQQQQTQQAAVVVKFPASAKNAPAFPNRGGGGPNSRSPQIGTAAPVSAATAAAVFDCATHSLSQLCWLATTGTLPPPSPSALSTPTDSENSPVSTAGSGSPNTNTANNNAAALVGTTHPTAVAFIKSASEALAAIVSAVRTRLARVSAEAIRYSIRIGTCYVIPTTMMHMMRVVKESAVLSGAYFVNARRAMVLRRREEQKTRRHRQRREAQQQQQQREMKQIAQHNAAEEKEAPEDPLTALSPIPAHRNDSFRSGMNGAVTTSRADAAILDDDAFARFSTKGVVSCDASDADDDGLGGTSNAKRRSRFLTAGGDERQQRRRTSSSSLIPHKTVEVVIVPPSSAITDHKTGDVTTTAPAAVPTIGDELRQVADAFLASENSVVGRIMASGSTTINVGGNAAAADEEGSAGQQVQKGTQGGDATDNHQTVDLFTRALRSESLPSVGAYFFSSPAADAAITRTFSGTGIAVHTTSSSLLRHHHAQTSPLSAADLAADVGVVPPPAISGVGGVDIGGGASAAAPFSSSPITASTSQVFIENVLVPMGVFVAQHPNSLPAQPSARRFGVKVAMLCLTAYSRLPQQTPLHALPTKAEHFIIDVLGDFANTSAGGGGGASGGMNAYFSQNNIARNNNINAQNGAASDNVGANSNNNAMSPDLHRFAAAGGLYAGLVGGVTITRDESYFLNDRLGHQEIFKRRRIFDGAPFTVNASSNALSTGTPVDMPINLVHSSKAIPQYDGGGGPSTNPNAAVAAPTSTAPTTPVSPRKRASKSAATVGADFAAANASSTTGGNSSNRNSPADVAPTTTNSAIGGRGSVVTHHTHYTNSAIRNEVTRREVMRATQRACLTLALRILHLAEFLQYAQAVRFFSLYIGSTFFANKPVDELLEVFDVTPRPYPNVYGAPATASSAGGSNNNKNGKPSAMIPSIMRAGYWRPTRAAAFQMGSGVVSTAAPPRAGGGINSSSGTTPNSPTSSSSAAPNYTLYPRSIGGFSPNDTVGHPLSTATIVPTAASVISGLAGPVEAVRASLHGTIYNAYVDEVDNNPFVDLLHPMPPVPITSTSSAASADGQGARNHFDHHTAPTAPYVSGRWRADGGGGGSVADATLLDPPPSPAMMKEKKSKKDKKDKKKKKKKRLAASSDGSDVGSDVSSVSSEGSDVSSDGTMTPPPPPAASTPTNKKKKKSSSRRNRDEDGDVYANSSSGAESAVSGSGQQQQQRQRIPLGDWLGYEPSNDAEVLSAPPSSNPARLPPRPIPMSLTVPTADDEGVHSDHSSSNSPPGASKRGKGSKRRGSSSSPSTAAAAATAGRGSGGLTAFSLQEASVSISPMRTGGSSNKGGTDNQQEQQQQPTAANSFGANGAAPAASVRPSTAVMTEYGDIAGTLLCPSSAVQSPPPPPLPPSRFLPETEQLLVYEYGWLKAMEMASAASALAR